MICVNIIAPAIPILRNRIAYGTISRSRLGSSGGFLNSKVSLTCAAIEPGDQSEQYANRASNGMVDDAGAYTYDVNVMRDGLIILWAVS